MSAEKQDLEYEKGSAGYVSGNIGSEAEPKDVTGNIYGCVSGAIMNMNGAKTAVTDFIRGSVDGNVCGNVCGNVDGYIGGNVNGEIMNRNKAAYAVNGNVCGNITNSVFGNIRRNVYGNISGIVDGSIGVDVYGSIAGLQKIGNAGSTIEFTADGKTYRGLCWGNPVQS